MEQSFIQATQRQLWVKAPWTFQNTIHLYLVKKISDHVFENKCTAAKHNKTNLAFSPQWAGKRQNAVWNTFQRSLPGHNNDNELETLWTGGSDREVVRYVLDKPSQ